MTKIFIASLLAFTAIPALAGPPVTVTSFVQTADLDLASEAGQRALDKRLSRAIIEVCGEVCGNGGSLTSLILSPWRRSFSREKRAARATILVPI